MEDASDVHVVLLRLTGVGAGEGGVFLRSIDENILANVERPNIFDIQNVAYIKRALNNNKENSRITAQGKTVTFGN